MCPRTFHSPFLSAGSGAVIKGLGDLYRTDLRVLMNLNLKIEQQSDLITSKVLRDLENPSSQKSLVHQQQKYFDNPAASGERAVTS